MPLGRDVALPKGSPQTFDSLKPMAFALFLRAPCAVIACIYQPQFLRAALWQAPPSFRPCPCASIRFHRAGPSLSAH